MKVRGHERGTALVEFAIVSVAAFALIFGVIDFGRAMYTYHLVSEAARLGSRYAIVRGGTACPSPAVSPDPLQSYVSSQAPGIDRTQMKVTTSCSAPTLCSSKVTISCSNADTCISGSPYSGPGCLVTVNVTYPFTFLVPLVSKIQPSMTSSSTMVISQQ